MSVAVVTARGGWRAWKATSPIRASTGITPQPYVAMAATSRMSPDSRSGTGTK
jgi:hypothetical protein